MRHMETFNFLEYAAGTIYPEDDVNVYTDVDAAYKLRKVEKELAQTIDSDRVSELEVEAKALRERFEKSKAVVRMRGIPGKEEDRLRKLADEKFQKDDSLEKDNWFARALVAAHIVSVTNSEGAVDESPWDADKVETLYKIIAPENYIRINETVKKLSMDTEIFENVEVNPDF